MLWLIFSQTNSHSGRRHMVATCSFWTGAWGTQKQLNDSWFCSAVDPEHIQLGVWCNLARSDHIGCSFSWSDIAGDIGGWLGGRLVLHRRWDVWQFDIVVRCSTIIGCLCHLHLISISVLDAINNFFHVARLAHSSVQWHQRGKAIAQHLVTDTTLPSRDLGNEELV